jgi:hypothetical protein
MQDQSPSLRGFSQEDSYPIAIENGTGWESTKAAIIQICAYAKDFEAAYALAQEWDEDNEPPWGDKLKYQVTRLWNFVHSGEAQSFQGLPVRRFSRPDVPDFALGEAIVAKYGPGAAGKIRGASLRPPDAAHALDFVLPGNPWIGVSQYQPSDQQVCRREQIRGAESRFAWLCPNPFRQRQIKSGGKWSMKCDANVLRRDHVVLEFDLKPRYGWGPSIAKWAKAGFSALDVHGALFLWIAARTGKRPFMIVYSGNVSYHAWYDAAGSTEEEIAALVELTLPLSGDPVLLTPSQLFRMPGGTRVRRTSLNKIIRVRQEVVFWQPINKI